MIENRIEEDKEGNRIAMVSLYPKMNDDAPQIFTEMIFIVDRSGSMSGGRINRVKDTLHIFLRALPEGFTFLYFEKTN